MSTDDSAAQPDGEPASGAAAESSTPAESDPATAGPADDVIERRSVTEIKAPRTVGGVIYLCVLAAAIGGVITAAIGPWRSGVSWLALAMLAGAAARVALRTEDAGMLEVRRKSFDVTIMVTFGVLLLILAATIPDQG
ncbi:DUF3017 domain-containing protein [Nocardioides dubius]|uniref:DUF3017 domain-containing protein n=1 Tax=Nocardioides dubius TaxID=317019 RepID=A0ABP4EMV6_9ACTN